MDVDHETGYPQAVEQSDEPTVHADTSNSDHIVFLQTIESSVIKGLAEFFYNTLSIVVFRSRKDGLYCK